MPSDIRSFFGGKPASAPASQETASAKKVEASKPKGRKARAVIEDSDEDEEPPKKATSKKAPAKKQKPASPEGQPTTTSDYFGGSNKPKRSEPVRPKGDIEESESTPTKATKSKTNTKTSAKKETPKRSTRTSTNGKTTHYNDDDFDDLDNDDDIFQTDFKKSKRGAKDDYEEESEPEAEEKAVKRESRGIGRQPKIKDEDDFVPDEDDVDMKDVQPDDDFLEPDPDEHIVVDKPAKKPSKAQAASRKRKSNAIDDDEDEEEEVEVSPKAKKAAPAKATPSKKAKKDKDAPPVPESAEMQAILASIPTVRAPTPPPKDATGKYNFNLHAANTAPPAAAGTKEIPIGAENCLAGLSFVFTGQNQTLGRDEGTALVKRYGGKVMSAPSKKTSYVVLGTDAGPKKLQTIREQNLKTIDEDGFFELIRRLPANGGDSKAAEANAKKKAEEQKKIEQAAAELDKEQKAADKAAQAAKAAKAYAAAGSNGPKPDKTKAGPSVEDRLWTVKYAPTQLTQICGNKTQVEKLQSWLRAFRKNNKTGFKMPGKDGSGTFRAVIISGPPGIGKTTAAHLVAKIEGYDIVEMNASDTRSKKLMEEGLRGVLGTTSLLGYFAGDGKGVEASKKKLVLIMDEVDGMSAGDRGGVGALAAVCKKTSIPMILICNDRKLPKMKPFDFVTYELPFRRPTVDQVRSRIMTIAFREGLKMPPNVVDALIEGSNKDIRQVVNMISSAKLDQEAMDFDKTKEMSKAWEKHIVLKPWDITSKILGSGMFNPANKATLNDKIELYFNDHEFSYLMLQENYLGTKPELSGGYSGKERDLKILDLASKAADSISDGDLVDRMIHGSQQQWSLMPTHAVFSFVRPASFVAGTMAGNQTRFTSWLGKNSAQGKFTRMIKEIQGHMRLRASADRHEVRQQYVPILWRRLVDRLAQDGKEAVPEIIDLMDSYFLTRDDWDAIMELGVDSMNMENVKIESQSKATFTRLYNAQSHPLPFIKASTVAAPRKQAKEKPDLEEAIDESDDEAAAPPPEEEKKAEEAEEGDITKDKYIKAPKKKKAAAAPAKGKAKAGSKKRQADDDEDDDDGSEDEKKPPAKKGRGGGAAGRGRGRGGKK